MELFPKSEPFKTGFLSVGKPHEIYYEVCGNPKGFPLLHVHGGPGGGSEEEDRQYYNPEK